MADLFTLTQDAGNPAVPDYSGTFFNWGRREGDTRVFMRNTGSGTGFIYVRRLAPGIWGLVQQMMYASSDGFFCNAIGPQNDRFPPDGPYVGAGTNPYNGQPFTGRMNGAGSYDTLPPLPWPSGPFWYPWCCDDQSSYGCSWLSRCWQPAGFVCALSGVYAKPAGSVGTKCDQCAQVNGYYTMPYWSTSGAPDYTCNFGYLVSGQCELGSVQMVLKQGTGQQVIATVYIGVNTAVFQWRKVFDHLPIDALELNGVQFDQYQISYYQLSAGGQYVTVPWVLPFSSQMRDDLDYKLRCRFELSTVVIEMS